MSPISNKIKQSVDNYLNYAFVIDVVIVIILWFLNSKFSFFNFHYNAQEINIDIVSNIIGASISLAGFILASLTIIVAIRSNIKSKTPEQAYTPLELFFSVGTFKTIVQVFRIAIIELVICFVFAYFIWTISNNISNDVIFKSIVSMIFLMSVSTMRSLFVLFLMIDVNE